MVLWSPTQSMKQRTTTLLIIGIVAAAGCHTAQPTPDGSGRAEPTPHSKRASRPASTLLNEYRRVFSAFQEQQRENNNLRERFATSREEINELYERLAQEQKLRREAQLALDLAKAEIEAATAAKQTIKGLRTALDAKKTELAAVKTELKNRREELMKIILGQQEWNKYILDKLKLQQ